MMNEKQLIGRIRKLRQIRPRKDWVFATKSQILGNVGVRPQPFLFPFFKPVYAGLFLFIFLIGFFEFSQKALPGESLYILKRMTEKTQAVFVSEEEKPKMNLELANKRLEELTKIVETNQVRKLTPAINEYQASVSEAAKNLVKLKKVDKEIVEKTAKLEETKEKLEKTLGTNIGTEKYDNAISQLVVESQIRDLGTRTLTEEQKEILEKAKEDFENGNYSEALTKIWSLSQNIYNE